MRDEFVYIVKEKDREGYRIRYRSSAEQHLIDLDLTERLGHTIVKIFRVPQNLTQRVIKACSKFTGGEISLTDLEQEVESLKEQKRYGSRKT